MDYHYNLKEFFEPTKDFINEKNFSKAAQFYIIILPDESYIQIKIESSKVVESENYFNKKLDEAGLITDIAKDDGSG